MTDAIGTKIAAALVAAQVEIRHATLDRTNPAFKSRYATLASVIDAVRPVLAKYRIAVIQRVQSMSDCPAVGIETVLVHESGESINCGVLWLRPVKDDNPQAAGSAQTYARRYSLAAAVCISSEEDDDGNGASKPKAELPVASVPSSAPRADARPVGQSPAPAPTPAPAGQHPRFPTDPWERTARAAAYKTSAPQLKRMWAIFYGWLDAAKVTDRDERDATCRARICSVRGCESSEGMNAQEYTILLGDEKRLGAESIETARLNFLACRPLSSGAVAPADEPPLDSAPPLGSDEEVPF